MGAVLYPRAFAALTRWWGPRSVTALMVLTLADGLASTVFAPLTAALDAHSDWRATYLVLAVVPAVVTVPAASQAPARTHCHSHRQERGKGFVDVPGYRVCPA